MESLPVDVLLQEVRSAMSSWGGGVVRTYVGRPEDNNAAKVTEKRRAVFFTDVTSR